MDPLEPRQLGSSRSGLQGSSLRMAGATRRLRAASMVEIDPPPSPPRRSNGAKSANAEWMTEAFEFFGALSRGFRCSDYFDVFVAG